MAHFLKLVPRPALKVKRILGLDVLPTPRNAHVSTISSQPFAILGALHPPHALRRPLPAAHRAGHALEQPAPRLRAACERPPGPAARLPGRRALRRRPEHRLGAQRRLECGRGAAKWLRGERLHVDDLRVEPQGGSGDWLIIKSCSRCRERADHGIMAMVWPSYG